MRNGTGKGKTRMKQTWRVRWQLSSYYVQSGLQTNDDTTEEEETDVDGTTVQR